MKPWEVAPQLKRERLVALATRLIEIRCRALLAHEPEEGDGPWGLGTRVYERTTKQLSWAAGRDGFEWLSVILDGLFINLQIEASPVRFYRGDPDNPGANVVRGGLRDLEIAQAQACAKAANGDVITRNGTAYLDGMEPPATSWFWVIAVETVGEGTPVRVTVEQVSDAGDTRYRWKVPIDIAAIQNAVEKKFRGVAGVESMAKPPVEVGPVVVEPKIANEEAVDERG